MLSVDQDTITVNDTIASSAIIGYQPKSSSSAGAETFVDPVLAGPVEALEEADELRAV